MRLKVILIMLLVPIAVKVATGAPTFDQPKYIEDQLFTKKTTVKPAQAKEIEYRNQNTRPGDKGQYYIVDIKKVGKIFKVLNKRVGPSGTNWTRYEINLSTKQMRKTAGADDDISNMTTYPVNQQNWYDLVDGSSQSDLFKYVYNKYPH